VLGSGIWPRSVTFSSRSPKRQKKCGNWDLEPSGFVRFGGEHGGRAAEGRKDVDQDGSESENVAIFGDGDSSLGC
jgi:hypothetical protein